MNGTKLHSVEVKPLPYADDLAALCIGTNNISEVVFVTKTICDATGAAVNWRKCSVLFFYFFLRRLGCVS